MALADKHSPISRIIDEFTQNAQGKRKALEPLENHVKYGRPWKELIRGQAPEIKQKFNYMLESRTWNREVHPIQRPDNMSTSREYAVAFPNDLKGYTRPRSGSNMEDMSGEIFQAAGSCSSRSNSPPNCSLSSASTLATDSSSSVSPSPNTGSHGQIEDTYRCWENDTGDITPACYLELRQDIPMGHEACNPNEAVTSKKGERLDHYMLNFTIFGSNPENDREIQEHLEISSESLSNSPVPSPAPSPSIESHRTPSSCSGGEEDGSPVDGGSSSQSNSSSQVAVYGDETSVQGEAPNKLLGVLNSVLKTDPAVAKLMHEKLQGLLEWAPSSTDLNINSSVSALSLLNIKDPSPLHHHGNFTYSASSDASSSSSSSSTTSSSGGVNKSLSSSGNNGSGGNKSLGSGNTARGSGDSGGQGQSTREPKTKPKSNIFASDNKAHSLRCVHNVLQPAIFCTNHQTREKYRTCAGPGWDITHLKDHMKSTHRKTPESLKCVSCQDTFKNQDALTHHANTVDCPIRCPDCRVEFVTKTMRTAHQEERHSGVGNLSHFMEIDDSTWKKMNENLKKFTSSPKPGEPNHDPNSKIAQWIKNNTPRYMTGRLDNAKKAYIELGQWYTIFATLALPESAPPEHPFYDYLSVTELVQERVILIHESLIISKIQEHGVPPPSDHNNMTPQVGWYKDILRETLRIASHTKLRVEQQSAIDTPMVTPYPATTNVEVMSQPVVYSSPELMVHGTPAMLPPQLPMMDRQLSNMSVPQEPFFQHDQQQQAENGMVWTTQQPVEAFSFPTPQSYNSQQGYSAPQNFNTPLSFHGETFSHNTGWQEPHSDQNPSELGGWQGLQPSDQTQRRQ